MLMHLPGVKTKMPFCATRTLKYRIAESRQRLYRVAFAWCGEATVADDLVQETLTIALQRVGQLRHRERLNAWLYTILSNCWKQHLRQSRRIVELEEDRVSCNDNPEIVSSELELCDHVRRAILKLPLSQRQTITLIDLAGFSYAEVAKILDIPIGTVMSRLYRGRKLMEEAMLEYAQEHGYIRSGEPTKMRSRRDEAPN